MSDERVVTGDGWARITIGDACEIVAGTGFPMDLQGRPAGRFPFFKVGDISAAWKRGQRILTTAEHYIDEEDLRKLRTRPLPVNTIVFAKIGAAIALNRRALLGQPSLVDNNVMGLIPDAGVLDHRYLYWYSTTWRLEEFARATTVPSLRKGDVENIPLPLPPLAEQGRIVGAIEEHLSDLDAAVAAVQRARANLERFHAATLEAAVTGALANSTSLNGVISTPWRVATLAEVSDIQGGLQKQPKRRPLANHYPFLRVANVHRGRLVLDDIHRIELFAGELERLRLERGDLLIVEGNGSAGEIGRMAVWDGSIANCVHQNHIIRARPHSDVNPQFLSIYWNSPQGMRRVQAAASSTSGLHTLSVAKVGRVPVPMPPRETQDQIVREVDRRLSAAKRACAEIEVQLARAKRLRQSILKRAFEGNLVMQDPNDEPASAVLSQRHGAPIVNTSVRRVRLGGARSTARPGRP